MDGEERWRGCEVAEVGEKRGMREGGEDEQRPMERSSEHKKRGGRRVSSGGRREGDWVAISGNLKQRYQLSSSNNHSYLIPFDNDIEIVIHEGEVRGIDVNVGRSDKRTEEENYRVEE